MFLRVAAASLDNAPCERSLKQAILHRKNSLFYKTLNGAQVGDLYMSLIHTSELNGANPFDYLTDPLATLQESEHLGVGFELLTEALDLTTPAGRTMAAAGRLRRLRA